MLGNTSSSTKAHIKLSKTCADSLKAVQLVGITSGAARCGEEHVEPVNQREVLNTIMSLSPSGFKFYSKASLNLISEEGFYSL